MACRGVEQVPVEVFDDLLVVTLSQRRHGRVGRHVGMDRVRAAEPLDGALDESTAVDIAGVVDGGSNPCIVRIEEGRRPECLCVSPMRALEFPTRGKWAVWRVSTALSMVLR